MDATPSIDTSTARAAEAPVGAARRRRRHPASAPALVLAFARHLTGHLDAEPLRRIADSARPEDFWEALESFTDSITGSEWRRISRELHWVREVNREMERLQDRSPWRRALAARHIGLLAVPGTRAPLRRVMAKGPGLVTLTAALALARRRDGPALQWLLANPRATATRGRQQLVALILRFGPTAAEHLLRWIDEIPQESAIFFAAVEAIGALGEERARPPLETLLRGGPLEARVAAARSLGRLASPVSVPALMLALEDPAWQVQAQVASALGRIGDPIAVPELAARAADPSWWVRRNAAYALARHGAEGRATLEKLAATSPDRYAAEMAVEVHDALAVDDEGIEEALGAD
ncbi:MAG: hypothetical protein A2W00_08480 [Candidatus Eisenbacteria bacterium RBG_16_71_46]|nr:MAG: hypothetical protein A2W00_08480 [Candidatus Eisenbacteria bacterium RBG_16_71_46]